MKSLILGTAVLTAFLLSGQALATETVRFDGRWWQSHNNLERGLLIEGELDGVTNECQQTAVMYAYSRGLMSVISSGLDKNARQARENKVFQRTKKEYKSTTCAYSHKFGIYANDVTNFYLDHPDMRSTTSVGQIVRCYNDQYIASGKAERCAAGTWWAP